MANLPIKIACGPYDRMEGIRRGDVAIPGVDATYIAIDSAPEIFRRMIETNAFDVSEMSASTFLSERSQDRFPFVAISVFPSRVFRHGYIFINRRSGIAKPTDLAGKRIGLEGYKQTAAVWIRGVLQEDYNVDLSQVCWFQGRLESQSNSNENKLNPPPGARVEGLARGASLNGMLVAGELDALIGPRIPSALGKNPDIVRLFENYRQVEQDYFTRTKIFPIMHTIVIREALHRQEPWLAKRLFDAFTQSKNLALKQMRFSGAMRYMLPWLYDDIDEIDKIFSGDPWPYGLEANRPTLDALAKYLFDQKFVPKPISWQELFLPVE